MCKHRLIRVALPLVAALAGTSPRLVAADAARQDAAAPGAAMDYGPFLAGSLDRDRSVSEKHSNESTEQDGNPNALTAKAIVVRLGDNTEPAAIAFDTDLLRYAVGWTGGFVNLDKTHLASMKGSVPLAPVKEPRLSRWRPTWGWRTWPAATCFGMPWPAARPLG